MTPRTYSNIAVATTITGAITAGATSLVVADATGYPAAPFAIVVESEVMLVTAKAGTTFTVTRGYDGTTAASHSAGVQVIHAAIADDLRGSQLGTRDVATDAPSNGDVLTWDDAQSRWEPAASSGGGAPSGPAGGVLGGTYPNPSFAVDMATQAELDAEATTRATDDSTLAGLITSEANARAAADLLRLLASNNLSDLANAGTARTNLGLGALAVLSNITASLISDASANGRSLITAADYATMRTLLALVIGTNVQAWDADLDTLATMGSTRAALLAALPNAVQSILDDPSIGAIRATLQVEGRTTFSNANYTALATDKYIAQTGTLSASRTVTLPAASALPAGYVLIIADESGTVTSSNTIVLARAGSDTINGATSYTITTPYAQMTLVSDGTSKWSYDVQGIGRGGTGATTAAAALTALGAQQAVAQGRLVVAATTYYNLPNVAFNAQSTLAIAANTARYFPIKIDTSITIDQLVTEVTTASGSGGSTARLALYAAGTDWQVGALVVDGGTVATDSTGVKAATVNTVVSSGRYYLVINADVGFTARSIRGSLVASHMRWSAGSSSVFVGALTVAQTYGAFPSTGDAISTVTFNTTQLDYAMAIRVSVP